MDIQKRWLHQVLIAADQLANAIASGWADETLSSRAYRCSQQGHKGWTIARKAINGLFFWQPNHCQQAYNSEQQRKHLPPEFRDMSSER